MKLWKKMTEEIENEEKNLINVESGYIQSDSEKVELLEENEIFDESEAIPVEESVILEDVSIVGDVSSKTNLTVYGYIKGSVDCKYKLHVQGKLDATISAGCIEFVGAQINGPVECADEILIAEKTVVYGDIVCGSSCILDGTVYGNITVTGSVEVRSNAIIEGNIIYETISLMEGAQINGMLNVRQKIENKNESELVD